MTNPTPTPCMPSSTESSTPWSTNSPAVAEHLDAAGADILAFTSFPKAIWRQIWSNNPQERLNREIRRPHRRRRHLSRTGPPLVRLVGAVLAEQHDEWTKMRRYIGLDILAKSRLTKITDPNPTDPEVKRHGFHAVPF